MIDGCSVRTIKLQFHFQMIISPDFCFSVSQFLTCPSFGGLNLQVNPLHEGALFFQFLFIFFRVLSLRGSLPKILSPDKTISKQLSHQSPQRQCGLEARTLIQEPEEKYSLHRRPVGIIYYWRQPRYIGWHSRNCGKFTLELSNWLISQKRGLWQDRVKRSVASRVIWNFPWLGDPSMNIFLLSSCSLELRAGNL